MDVFEALLTRRSIRKYTSQPVPQEWILDILKAAMYAPSANNQQPWRFIVIRERQTLDAITAYHPYAQMLKEAPLAIAVCADRRNLKSEIYWVQDCSAATQNLLLAAHSKGLGSVWIGIYPRSERVENTIVLLGLPEGVTPLCIVALGFPDETVPQPQRFDPTKIHYEKW